MADFASMLQFLRKREHLSQRELAEKIGMSPSAIGMYESGKRQPRHEDEETIADFFNVDLNTLRGRRIYEDMPEDTDQAKKIRELYKTIPSDYLDNPEFVEQLAKVMHDYVLSDTTNEVRIEALKTYRDIQELSPEKRSQLEAYLRFLQSDS